MKSFLNVNDFMPHGMCYLWQKDILFLHVISDAVIGLAYYSIPFALVYFVSKRKDIAFSWIFMMFAMFILACGTSHLFSILTTWEPYYGIEGLIKAVTAIVSLATAVMLWYVMPKALAFPTPQEMAAATERLAKEKLEKRFAQKASAEKSAFLANVSHEFKTPLNAIIGYSEMIEEDLQAGDRGNIEQDLTKIKTSARHLSGLLLDLLDLSRIEAGKLSIFPADVPLDRIFADAADTVMPLVKDNGNELKIENRDNIGDIHIDPDRLRQCLVNLLSNAAKFTHNGSIKLYTEKKDDILCIHVEDTGRGIPATETERIFKKFTQLDNGEYKKGVGLGLSITRKLCELMNAEISVRSEPGKGSLFTIRLPRSIVRG